MRYIALVVVLAAALPTHAQSANSIPPPPPTPEYTYDCSQLPYSSAGCGSYNQMINKGDKDLMETFKENFHSLVCFRPNEDTFIVLSFADPLRDAFAPVPSKPGISKTTGFLNYERFKDGVADETEMAFGDWTKLKVVDSIPFFNTANSANPNATLSDTELDYTYSYKNLAGTTTRYVLQLRRSTLRFNESFTYAEPSGKQPTKRTPSQNQITVSGYCTEFQAKHS